MKSREGMEKVRKCRKRRDYGQRGRKRREGDGNVKKRRKRRGEKG